MHSGKTVLGATSQFEKASLVAKLKAARDRKRRESGKCEGRPSYSQTHAAPVAEVRDLRRRGQTLQSIADALAERGYVNRKGHPFAPTQIARMCARRG